MMIQASLRVDARRIRHRLSPYWLGACIEDVNHEIYGGLYSQMVFGESFQEPPPPVALQGFQSLGGSWRLEGDEVRVGAGDGPKLILTQPELTQGRVAVELFLPELPGGPAGLILKVRDAAVGADRFTGYEVSVNPANKTLLLGRHRQNWEPLTTVPCEIPVGHWITLAVELGANTLEVWVEGRSVLRYTDTEHPLVSGAVGLRPWQRSAQFRNLQVNGRPVRFVPIGEPSAVSGMWRAVQTGSARGELSLETSAPFVGRQSQRLTLFEGTGTLGIENRGLNRVGMALQAGKPYEGVLCVRSQTGTPLTVALQSADGTQAYAEKTLTPRPDSIWQRLTFTLTPRKTDPAARLSLVLRQPGSIDLGYAFLQPGPWGRFKGLPVRKDVVEGLRAGGMTVLRYGGSMVNTPEYRWKKMIGPREQRPPYTGLWYPHSSNGWGILDFLNVCEAAGFLAIPALHLDETPQDIADFIEYVNGPADSPWGRRRVADGHPKPYGLRYIELGNEEAVDEAYGKRFEPLARAIWSRDPKVIPVVGDFAYDQRIDDPFRFAGAPRITSLAAHKKILDFARSQGKEVWFDVHVWNQEADQPAHVDGVRTFIEHLERLSPGARFKVVIFELNADKHGIQRALGTARAVNLLQQLGDRVPLICSANGLQPDGQNDNGWNQGLVFLNPAQVWFQPPYYALQLLAQHRLPEVVASEVGGGLSVTALCDTNRHRLHLQVVNAAAKSVTAVLALEGFVPKSALAEVDCLQGPLEAVNTAAQPQRVLPQRSHWRHGLDAGSAEYTFPAHSFTLLRLR